MLASVTRPDILRAALKPRGAASSSGLAVRMPAIRLVGREIHRTLGARTVIHDAAGTKVVAGAPYALAFDEGAGPFAHASPQLPDLWIGSTTIAGKTRGVDYEVFADYGKLCALSPAAAGPATLDYVALAARYDLIQFDPSSGAISVAKGTERYRDPEEYPPTPSSGLIALYRVLVVGSAIRAVDYCGDWINGLKIGSGQVVERLGRQNRRRIGGALRAVEAGGAVDYHAYGDSITAIPIGIEPIDHVSPNGPRRDRPEAYFSDYPSDTYSQIVAASLKTAAELGMADDGAGRTHVAVTAHWGLVEALRARNRAAAVNYYNWGKGATTSGTGHAINGAPNGLEPVALNALKAGVAAGLAAGRPQLVAIAYGMNEIGSPETFANVVAIATELKSLAPPPAGVEIIVFGVYRFNTIGGVGTQASYRFTNVELRRAAEAVEGGFLSLEYLSFEGSAPLASFGMANVYNHPGWSELQHYKRRAPLLFGVG